MSRRCRSADIDWVPDSEFVDQENPGMSPATKEILRAALALTESERSELIEELLAAEPGPRDLPFDPAWLDEIQRRSAEIDGGGITLKSWAELRDRVRRRVKDHAGG
jgi:hypothetical protein